MAGVEGALLAGRAPRYVQLATAAVPDGPEVVDRWHALGAQQAQRLGVEPVPVPVVDRATADDPGVAGLVAGAGLVYLSGGHPAFLADTLRGTLVWTAVLDAWRSGAALAGCSAGAMALTSWVPSIRHPRRGATPGLGVLPHLRVIPHFDAFAARMPDVATRFLLPGEGSGDVAAVTLVGIDEDTAVVGGPTAWVVQGRQSAWVLTAGGRQEHPAGSTVATPAG